jgi:hypothetical protein
MPLYEYTCEADGETITLLRPKRDADKPVDDPAGRGRVFVRRHSTFQVNGAARPGGTAAPSRGCSCGNPHGPCHS